MLHACFAAYNPLGLVRGEQGRQLCGFPRSAASGLAGGCLGAQRCLFTDGASVLDHQPLLDARRVEVVPALHPAHVLAIGVVFLQTPKQGMISQ